MKAIITEISGGICYVMTSDGLINKAKTMAGYEVGSEIDFIEKPVSVINIPKKYYKSISAAVLIFAFISVFTIMNVFTKEIMVNVEINPSVYIVIKNDYTVKKIKAGNDDAKELLNNYNGKGIDIKTALDDIFSLAKDKGYLNEDSVNTVIATNSREVELYIKDSAIFDNADDGSVIVLFSVDENYWNNSIKENKSPAKEKFISMLSANLPDNATNGWDSLSVHDIVEKYENIKNDELIPLNGTIKISETKTTVSSVISDNTIEKNATTDKFDKNSVSSVSEQLNNTSSQISETISSSSTVINNQASTESLKTIPSTISTTTSKTIPTSTPTTTTIKNSILPETTITTASSTVPTEPVGSNNNVTEKSEFKIIQTIDPNESITQPTTEVKKTENTSKQQKTEEKSIEHESKTEVKLLEEQQKTEEKIIEQESKNEVKQSEEQQKIVEKELKIEEKSEKKTEQTTNIT